MMFGKKMKGKKERLRGRNGNDEVFDFIIVETLTGSRGRDSFNRVEPLVQFAPRHIALYPARICLLLFEMGTHLSTAWHPRRRPFFHLPGDFLSSPPAGLHWWSPCILSHIPLIIDLI
ncbi:hypothetical protein SLA2020_215600 [Shorea laevis]